MLPGLAFFIIANPILTYSAVFLGMFIEGEGIVLIASIFAWQGHLSWFWLSIVVVTGMILGDLVWYTAGRTLQNTTFGKWLDRRYEKQGTWISENIVGHYAKYAILSKFMYFAYRPILFLVGWHNLPFKKFFRITIYSTVVWAAIVLLIGYFFGYTVDLIGFKKIAHRLEIVAIVVFGGLFLFEWLVRKFVWNKKKGTVSATVPSGTNK